MENKGRSCNCYQIVIKGTFVKPENLDFTGFFGFRISFPLDGAAGLGSEVRKPEKPVKSRLSGFAKVPFITI